MPKVKVKDIEIYYETHGEELPLIMIQGLGFSSEMWSYDFIGKLEVLNPEVLRDVRRKVNV